MEVNNEILNKVYHEVEGLITMFKFYEEMFKDPTIRIPTYKLETFFGGCKNKMLVLNKELLEMIQNDRKE